MKPFSEEMRYEYPLTEDSWVIDVGAHTGTFSREIYNRYKCRIMGFEPVTKFWKQAIENQPDTTKILHCGLSDKSEWKWMGITGDSSGEFADDNERELVLLAKIDLLQDIFEGIDLLKLNIEGGEYAVLERILDVGMQNQIINLQVQFHTNAPEYQQRRLEILDKFADTHVLTYCYPYIWENLKRK